MSDAERQSPRTAIRNWLQVTDSKSTTKPADAFPEEQDIERGSRYHSRRHHMTNYPSKPQDQYDKQVVRKYQRQSGTRQKRVTDEVLLVNSHQARPQIHLKENTAGNSNRLGLAERLGLHAPFRTFKDQSDHNIVDVQGRPRKRRRSNSSTSSYLEPAAVNDLSENGHDRLSRATKLRAASTGPSLGDRGKNISPTTSQGSEMMLPSPEKLQKSYERGPRHKTRQDRYDFKDNNRDSEKTKQAAKKDRGGKKRRKHKRKEKSGAALMHDFAAQNVAHDRLTLKPAKTLGLFGKGRASSPVRRRGLPDLAFSEMTFLTSRREKPKDSFEDMSNRPSDKMKRRKSTKAVDTEAEISKYFTSAKPTSLDITSPNGQRYQQDKRWSRGHESPQAFVDLPDRPFLGFGSCGPNTSMSPAKTPVNTDSKGLRRGDTRSPTRSTSYLTWSQSGEPCYASPPPDRRHHVEPLASSKLSSRKRASSSPPKGEHSMPPASPPCIQTTLLGTQSAASRPPLKHGNANEAPGQKSESRLTTGERLKSRKKSQNHGDTGTIELDAAKSLQDIEDSVQDNTHPAEAPRYGGPESALPPRNQTACQSSGQEPQCERQAHDARPLSAQMPIISPHKDPLDDILEALLRDCSTTVAGSDSVSRATTIHRNFYNSEEARTPDRIKQRSRVPAHPYVNCVDAPEAPASALNSFRKLRSASLQQFSPHDGSKSTHTQSRGSLKSSNRPNIGHALNYSSIPTQNQVNARNAWNSYGDLYERQQAQADLTLDTSREHISPYTAVQDDLSGQLRETDHSAGPSEYATDLHSVEAGYYNDDYRPYLYKTLQEGNENDNYREIRHGEWDDQYVDHGASSDSRKSLSEESHQEFSNGILVGNHVNDYQEREIHADHEQSFAQGADQHEIEHQLLTTNMPKTHSPWRSYHLFNSNYGLERHAADAQVEDVDPALSGFWTPHKLY